MVTPPDPTLTVFYDGACPLCSREIAYYRRRRGADAVAWVDIAEDAEAALPACLAREDALRRFHVMRADGTLVSGGRAFALLWTALPGLRMLGRLGQWPPVAALLETAYRLFLPLRPWIAKRFRRGAG